MPGARSYLPFFVLLILAAALLFMLDLSIGSVAIPLKDTLRILSGSGASEPAFERIIMVFRLPRVLTALLAGAALAVSGLLMQTLFRNPLAGPYVLGISSGASLGVALLVLAGGLLPVMLATRLSWVVAAALGAAVVLAAVLLLARTITDTATLLIIGLMFGSIAGAVVGILQYLSRAEALQAYVFWTFGSLAKVRWQDMPLFAGTIGGGLLLAFALHKPLNAFALDDKQVQSLGVNIRAARTAILLATSLLAGVVTAFCGPVAFVGLAVPHLVRLLVATARHEVLLPAVALGGMVVLLFCDLVAQLPGFDQVLPINIVTALVGGPVVIWLLISRRNLGKAF